SVRRSDIHEEASVRGHSYSTARDRSRERAESASRRAMTESLPDIDSTDRQSATLQSRRGRCRSRASLAKTDSKVMPSRAVAVDAGPKARRRAEAEAADRRRDQEAVGEELAAMAM